MIRSTRFIEWVVPLTLVLGVAAFATEESSYEQILNVVYFEQDGVGLLMDVFAPKESAGPGKGLGIACVTSGAWKSECWGTMTAALRGPHIMG